MNDRLDKIEAQIQGASNIPEETKSELLQLVQELRTEAASHAEETQNMALEGLSGPVGELETAHPRLMQIVNRLASALSSVGI